MVNMIKENEISQKLNLKRLNQVRIDKDLPILDVEPYNLINHKRFDIMAKYIYGEFQENAWNSSWGYRLYENHMWVFNQYDEDDESGKKGIKSFISSFNFTLKSVKDNGFDDTVSLLPINENNVPIDGAHRLTAALLYDKKVSAVKIKNHNLNYNYEFFRNKGLLSKWSDAMTYEYCKLKSNTFIVLLFPNSIEKKEKVKEVLDNFGDIYYEKEVYIKKEGPRNLIKLLAEDEKWLEDFSGYKNDPEREIGSFFNGDGTIGVLIFETTDFRNLSMVKIGLRDIYGESDFNFYINEKHQDTIRLTQMLLNENSIHFLNNAISDSPFKDFEENLNQYKKFIKRVDIDIDSICLISNEVLAAYGLRDSVDFVFIQNGQMHIEDENSGFERLINYNSELIGFKRHIDDIIFNPENHFYYQGVKFASLNVVKEIKKKQGVFYDREGILMIKNILGIWLNNINKELIRYTIKKRTMILKLKVIAIKLALSKFYKKLRQEKV
ncbi:hypothetical protein [Aquibacillus saliphilus]|uniref:hypothetical protein n=1 Tax=Aquibacillus saliphilus TaxID=1909422 RepID=UPI001CEFFCDA|nr:hypothetical protein [Aquibacillus saliphilus]